MNISKEYEYSDELNSKKKKMNFRIQRSNHRGMTLLEVTITLMLVSLFFVGTIQFLTSGVKYYYEEEKKYREALALQSMMYFLEGEIDEAMRICVYVFNKDYEEIGVDIPLCHNGIGEAQDEVYRVRRLVFDEGIVDQLGRDKARVMWIHKNNADGMFEIKYQGQTLIEGIEGMTATSVNGKLILDVWYGEDTPFTFRIPQNHKKKVTHERNHTS